MRQMDREALRWGSVSDGQRRGREKICESERRDWAMCRHMTAARAKGKVN